MATLVEHSQQEGVLEVIAMVQRNEPNSGHKTRPKQLFTKSEEKIVFRFPITQTVALTRIPFSSSTALSEPFRESGCNSKVGGEKKKKKRNYCVI